MFKPLLLGVASARLCLAHSPNSAEVPEFDKPTDKRAHIVFNLTGNLWIAARESGTARQLTTDASLKTDPRYLPNSVIYGTNGDGEVENSGVIPNIEVERHPAAWRQATEKAAAFLIAELKKSPAPKSKRPVFPVYQSGTKAVDGSGN